MTDQFEDIVVIPRATARALQIRLNDAAGVLERLGDKFAAIGENDPKKGVSGYFLKDHAKHLRHGVDVLEGGGE